MKTDKDREPKCTHYPVKSKSRLISMRGLASKAKNGHLRKRPYTCIRCGDQNLAHFLECFAILLTLCVLHMADRPAMPTNSNVHLSLVSSKVIEMHVHEAYTANTYN